MFLQRQSVKFDDMIRKTYLLLSLFLLAQFTLAADHVSHAPWDALLKKFVSAKGNVNYKAWKSDISGLDKYLESLSNNAPKSTWSENARKAYWMNAYNAYTVKLILLYYPVKSIKDIGGFASPWKMKFFKIGGVSMDLNHIEHEVLRVEFNDPRIHAGINCASYSCPQLSTTAFTEENVDEELTKLMKEFVNDPTKNKISAGSVELSEIFKWFEKDFTKKGNLIDFLNQYANTKINTNAKKTYLKYNWTLNE